MAHALSQFNDGDEEYLFLVWHDSYEWLEPYVSEPCRLLLVIATQLSGLKKRLVRSASFATSARAALPRLIGKHSVRVDRSDGTIERAGVNVMHFIKQSGFLTNVPSVYHPHDLQHRHFPNYFRPPDLLYREIVYGALCEQADVVAVTSSWVRQDVVEQLDLPENKVQVVPLAPVLTAYPDPSRGDLEEVRRSHRLPDHFVLYPAHTWAHKNHLRLLDALALLRDRGIDVSLVCCGGINDFYSKIVGHTKHLRLDHLVHFIGFVSPLELQALYKLATAVVIPSKFEAASGPLWDAFLSGVPAACSSVTSLPDQAGDAALLFNPDDADEIARSLECLWLDPELRRCLAVRGKERVSRFTWERTARHFRAHYRRIDGRPLSDEDQEILSARPLL
jgi:glycosyltransferase involved in cell wall biosynthesis